MSTFVDEMKTKCAKSFLGAPLSDKVRVFVEAYVDIPWETACHFCKCFDIPSP